MISFGQMAKDIIARLSPFPLPKDIPDFASPLWPLMPFGPVIDGTDVGLQDQPYTLMTKGEFSKVPLIVGANKDGGAYFGAALPLLWGDMHWNFTKTVEWFLPNKTDQQRALEIYGDDSFPSDRYRMNRFMRDLTFQCSDRDVATAWSDAGERAYLYVFSFDFTGFMEKTFGDAHAFELPFVWRNYVEVFGALSTKGTVAGYEHMADIMSCSWASFVNCQTPKCVAPPPNCKDVLKTIPDWPLFSSKNRMFMSLKSEPTVETIGSTKPFLEDEFPGDDRCDFLKTIDMDWQPIKKKIQRVWLDSARTAKVIV
jgi:carboxylesterase type B